MGIKITIYVGSDNRTQRISDTYEKKIKNITGKYWPSFTVLRAKGMWKNQSEDVAIIYVYTKNLEFSKFDEYLQRMKLELKQEKILYEINCDSNFQLK